MNTSTIAGPGPAPPLQLWGGIECTVNRVGDSYHDQLELTGHAGRIEDRFLDEQVGLYPGVTPGGNGRERYVDVEAVRACHAISGHRAILHEAWERYRTPVALTEVHLGSTREEQMRWLLEASDSAHMGRSECRVRAAAALAAANPWRAPGDQRVSPTYVPDLVNVSLDLLIDGASGIWHQANEGDVSWSELARKAAAALGYAESGVDECATAALRLAAVRPAYSVLGTERGQRLPPLEDALGRFVSERAAGQRPSCPTVSNTLADNGNQEFGPYRDTAA